MMKRKHRDAGPRVAHRTLGRIRILLPESLSEEESDLLLKDLKLSPKVNKVTMRGSSLIVEHYDECEALTTIGRALNRMFPDFPGWSDEFDATFDKYAADPWVNKMVPLSFLSLALYRGVRDGAFLAGESAFALAYIAFDLYWKFQQENLMRKLKHGMSNQEVGATMQ